MRKTLLSLLGFFLLAGIASAPGQPRTFKVPFHTLNGMILLDTGADNCSVSPSIAGVTTKLDALKPERRAGGRIYSLVPVGRAVLRILRCTQPLSGELPMQL